MKPHSVTLLASAERTATAASADQPNEGYRGVLVTLDVTAVTDTPSLTLSIQHKDPASGKYEALLTASAAVTAQGTHSYLLYPGVGTASGDVTQVASFPLGSSWRVNVAAADADAATYSVGATLLI